MYLCIHARAGGKEEAGQTSSAPPSRIRGNRFAIKSPLNKRETRVLETWARKIISNVHSRVHTCVATMYARSGRVQPVNQRMSRKPTGQTGGCVIRACAHQPRFCVCVCVHESWTKIGRSRLPVRNNLEAINCGSNILEEAGSSNRISESRV